LAFLLAGLHTANANAKIEGDPQKLNTGIGNLFLTFISKKSFL